MSALSLHAAKIAALNDEFRSRFGVPVFGEGVPGKFLMTSGITNLPPEIQIDIWMKVRNFKLFDEDNDPYGEHDFGSFDHPKAGTINWKIDYFEDGNCEYGSEHPEDPEHSYRVMTIMRANEW